ncbi:MAG: DNA topoisomerase IV subunit B, partial [Parcubacteria group bacterium]|nr:DNA topoisomerase IV subunit B [Parcubacteria group bacterium]
MPKEKTKREKPVEVVQTQIESKSSYEAKDIYVLEGLEPVRRRPGMYIGSTGPEGLHHLVWECVDNSLDEALAGYAKNIEVRLLPENRVSVKDDGRGIPVDIHPQTKKSALETVMTTLHAGGKFGGTSYKISGGLHGVGVSVVCALSQWMRAEVCRNGFLWRQEYERGKVKTKVVKGEKCGETGTTVIFEPDPEVFSEIKFDWKKVMEHLREQAYLTKGVRILVVDERLKEEL